LDRGRVVFDGPKGNMTPEDFIAKLHKFAKN